MQIATEIVSQERAETSVEILKDLSDNEATRLQTIDRPETSMEDTLQDQSLHEKMNFDDSKL